MLHELCVPIGVTSVVMLKWPPIAQLVDPPQTKGVFTLIDTEQSHPAMGPRRSSRRRMPPTSSTKAWACSVPQFPLLPGAHPACVNVNRRSPGGLHRSNLPSGKINVCI